MNEINLNPVITQLALRELAKYGANTLGNDSYYLKNFVELLIPVFGEDNLIEMLKNDKGNNSKRNNEMGINWFSKIKGMSKKLQDFNSIILKTKWAWDCIENKEFTKLNKDPNFSNFIKNAEKVSRYTSDITSLAIFMITSTPLKNTSIPSELWKILDQKNSRIGEFDKRRIGDRPPEPPRAE
jgi:hypothetical protein